MLTWPEPDLKPINLWSLPLYKNDSAFNFETTNAYKDMQWLKYKKSNATQDDLENFADKCASVAIDNPDYTDEETRCRAYDALWGMK